MARHGTAHWDVAAYALGVLGPADVAQCEAHLAECESCAAELESLLPATKLLADVDLESLRAAEESQLAERLLESVRTDRQRSRRRHRMLAAAGTTAAAVVTGVALLAGATFLDPPTTGNVANPPATVSPTPGEPPGIGGPELGDGDKFSATDPDSGAHAEVLVGGTDWGTQVAFTIASVTGPLECQLQVVGTDGSVEVIGSWRVPEEGYGTPQQPEPLLVRAATASYQGEIAQLRVLATDPAGEVSTLVAVDV